MTEDPFFGGRIILRQPASGYRAAIDPVFLAAGVPAGAQDHILDMGCGVGAAALCLAARVPGCRIAGFEVQRDLVRLAGDNIQLNHISARISVMQGDLLKLPPRLAPGSFDHVMANPPFLEAGAATAPADHGTAMARLEGAADLAAWVRAGLLMVRAKGSLTFIHRADRLEALLALLAGKAGEITVFPLWPGAGKPAKRVVLRARKAVATPTRLLPGMTLHLPDGRFTPAAEAVLRDAAPLEL
ncbi:MAG: methyltransferase [Alphaproteobacteria bacterium]|nr:methyltransferase [Alphaproteobacteria bacterium]